MILLDTDKLTEPEGKVLEYLGMAFNHFVNLPVFHDDDSAEFRHAIHAAQNIVLSRTAYSDMPLKPEIEKRLQEIKEMQKQRKQ